MKQIKGYFHLSMTDFDEFNKNFKNYLNALQNDGQEVEIQYKTNTGKNKDYDYLNQFIHLVF